MPVRFIPHPIVGQDNWKSRSGGFYKFVRTEGENGFEIRKPKSSSLEEMTKKKKIKLPKHFGSLRSFQTQPATAMIHKL